MRWLFLLGAFVGFGVAVIRQMKRGNGAYDAIFGVADPFARSGLIISWHAVTLAILLVSAGMVYAFWAPPHTARAIGVAAALFFAGLSALFLVTGLREFGSPFALWPWALLLVPALCGAAGAWRAGT